MRPRQLPWHVRLRSNVLQAPPFFLTTALFASAALAASTFDKQGSLQHRIARVWARNCLIWPGARVEVIGLENIPAETIVLAANHTSYMDTPVIFSSLPFQFRILAKKELWQLPFIGWYLNRSGQLPIDIENPRATVSSLGGAVRALRSGMNVFVFPEGGRTPDGQLQPFLNGAAYLAIRAQVPLVPMALIGVYDLLPMHTSHFYPDPSGKPIKLVIGQPIPTTTLTIRDSDKLTAQLRETIAALIAKHS